MYNIMNTGRKELLSRSIELFAFYFFREIGLIGKNTSFIRIKING